MNRQECLEEFKLMSIEMLDFIGITGYEIEMHERKYFEEILIKFDRGITISLKTDRREYWSFQKNAAIPELYRTQLWADLISQLIRYGRKAFDFN